MTRPKRPTRLMVCMNQRGGGQACCHANGAPAVLAALRDAAEGTAVKVEEAPCLAHCDEGPNVKIVRGRMLTGVAPDDAAAILTEALAANARDGT